MTKLDYFSAGLIAKSKITQLEAQVNEKIARNGIIENSKDKVSYKNKIKNWFSDKKGANLSLKEKKKQKSLVKTPSI